MNLHTHGCSVPCSRVSHVLRGERVLDIHSPHLQSLPDMTRTRDLWVTSPTFYPLGHDCPNIYIYIYTNTLSLGVISCFKICFQYKITVFYLNIFYIVVYFYNGKAKFIAVITPVFNVTRSFRNQFNMLICCSRNIPFLLLMLKTVVLFSIVNTFVCSKECLEYSVCLL